MWWRRESRHESDGAGWGTCDAVRCANAIKSGICMCMGVHTISPSTVIKLYPSDFQWYCPRLCKRAPVVMYAEYGHHYHRWPMGSGIRECAWMYAIAYLRLLYIDAINILFVLSCEHWTPVGQVRCAHGGVLIRFFFTINFEGKCTCACTGGFV